MGKRKSTDGDDAPILTTSIIDTIRSSKNGKSMELKELRTAALIASKHLPDGAEVDKTNKQLFKSVFKTLETDKIVTLSADGIVKLSKSHRAKGKSADMEEEPKSDKKKKKKKDKKRQRESKESTADIDGSDAEVDLKKKKKQISAEENHAENDEQNDEDAQNDDEEDTTEDNGKETIAEVDPKEKNKPCKNNPQGITRLFLGNLPFAITEPTLNDHLQNVVTHIKWITDKETGKFYGSAFCEIRCSKDAAKAMTKNGSMLMGRPLKMNYAPVRAGEEGDWPPRSKVITGGKVANAGKGGQAGGSGIKAMSVKPEGCAKLFIGNLSYDIDDDAITKFFMGVESEVKAVRWLFHKDSGDFKGCGYVDFWNSDACEKAAALNGKNLLGRPIRIDWTE